MTSDPTALRRARRRRAARRRRVRDAAPSASRATRARRRGARRRSRRGPPLPRALPRPPAPLRRERRARHDAGLRLAAAAASSASRRATRTARRCACRTSAGTTCASAATHPMLAGLPARTIFYFVHAYRAVPARSRDDRRDDVDYGGDFAAAVADEEHLRRAVPSGEEPGGRQATARRLSPPGWTQLRVASAPFELIPAIDSSAAGRAPRAGALRRGDGLLPRIPRGWRRRFARLRHPAPPRRRSRRREGGAAVQIRRDPANSRGVGGIPVQIGGGICATQAAVEEALAWGIDRVILGHGRAARSRARARGGRGASRAGSSSASTPATARSRSRAGREGSEIRAVDLARRVRGRRRRRASSTPTSPATACSRARTSRPRRCSPPRSAIPVIVSGGVATNGGRAGVRTPAREERRGVIVGRAIYTGGVDLESAPRARGDPLGHAALQAHHPVSRRRQGARREGRAVRRPRRRRRSRRGRAALRRAGSRRDHLPRHHGEPRSPAASCSTSCPARPRASSCRSASAGASARSRTSAICSTPAPTRSRS